MDIIKINKAKVKFISYSKDELVHIWETGNKEYHSDEEREAIRQLLERKFRGISGGEVFSLIENEEILHFVKITSTTPGLRQFSLFLTSHRIIICRLFPIGVSISIGILIFIIINLILFHNIGGFSFLGGLIGYLIGIMLQDQNKYLDKNPQKVIQMKSKSFVIYYNDIDSLKISENLISLKFDNDKRISSFWLFMSKKDIGIIKEFIEIILS